MQFSLKLGSGYCISAGLDKLETLLDFDKGEVSWSWQSRGGSWK